MTIKTKLITVSLLLLIIPLIIVGIFNYYQSSRSLEDIGETNLKNSAEMTVAIIDALQLEVEKGTLSLEEAQERVKIAILGEMTAEGTRPLNDDIDLGENGYLFIVDQNGNTIAHPNIEGDNMWEATDSNGEYFVQTMIENAQHGGGFSYYDFPMPDNENQIEPKVAYSQLAPAWDWTIVASTYLIDFNQPASQILHVMLIVTGITIIIGLIVIWFFSNHLTRPITQIVDKMKHLSQGDLSQESVTVTSKDEFSQLATSVNQMEDQLKTMILSISETSNTLSSQSEELSQSSQEVKSGAEQIAATMEELASAAENQASHASHLSTDMQSLFANMKEVNENSQGVEQYSDEVLHMTNEGSDLMNQSMEQMKVVDEIVRDAVNKVRGLDEHSREISQLVSVIHDISEQTNLLALNASIEAARAGEHGRGFAIVADEVRKLAEQVAESVTNITSIVTNIQQESNLVSTSLEDGYEEVEKGTTQIELTEKKFKDIQKAMTQMVTNIQDSAKNLASITEHGHKMNQSIEEVASISEEAAAGVEETAASSEETSSSMEEVSHHADALAKLAEELNGLVQRFKL